jgi:hypothetical protein
MEPRLVLPVSVEQVALVVRQMSRADRERLLDLVPDLHQSARQAGPRRRDDRSAAVERVRAEVTQAMAGRLLSLDEPFLGELTLGQYLQLPDVERGRLWDDWGQVDLKELEELDVRPDAVLAR